MRYLSGHEVNAVYAIQALGGALSMNRSLTALLLHSLFQGEDKPGHFPGTRFVKYIHIIIFRMTVDQHPFCQVVRFIEQLVDQSEIAAGYPDLKAGSTCRHVKHPGSTS